MPSAIHTGLAFRGNGGALNSVDHSLYYRGTEVIRYNATSYAPGANDRASLGTAALSFADLFLASGGVINFNNGDVTLTHVANRLSMGGGDFDMADGNGMVIGHSAQITFNALIPEAQVLGTVVGVDGAGAIALYSATAAEGPQLILGRSKSATLGTNTIVASGDVLGTILAVGADGGTGFDPAASIRFESDGTPGVTTDMPGRILFLTSPDGSQTQTEVFRVSADQNIYVANNNGLVIGHTAQITFGGALEGSNASVAEFQVLGTTGGANDHVIAVAGFLGPTAEYSPSIVLMRSRNAAIGSFTIVASGDSLGRISWTGDDGVDYQSVAAIIEAEVDGTPGVGDMPGRLLLRTTADGGETVTTRITIASTGLTTFAAGSTPASVGTTPGTAHAGSITATGGLGGNTTLATTATGGIGGGYSFTGGAGGTANSATTAATGGAGGAWVTTTGAGAAVAVAGVTSTGGDGGAVTYTTGAGGAVSLGVSGTATGGASGAITIQSGTGGAVTATTGTNVGGASGAVTVQSGTGGAASAATDTGGAGGLVTLRAGNGGNGDDTGGVGGGIAITAGNAGTGGNVAGGVITLTPGVQTGTGLVGYVTIPNAKAGLRIGGTTTAATTVGTNFALWVQGTAPAGTIATGGAIYSDATVMRKIIANNTDSAIG